MGHGTAGHGTVGHGTADHGTPGHGTAVHVTAGHDNNISILNNAKIPIKPTVCSHFTILLKYSCETIS